tara:strand:+ start:4821 stop:5087 length:267 start_codon:yes stop_codon:yes gene_type:complete
MKKHTNFKTGILLLITLALFGFFFTSCEDNDKNNLNDFLDGAAVKFSEPLPAVFGVNDPADLVFTATIEAPDGNVVSYSMEVQATLSA